MLIEQGVPVFERLRVSPACPLILPSHVALDRARERARGVNAIGTTGRGIGPAYEDKVSRRAPRISALLQHERPAAKLGEGRHQHQLTVPPYDGCAPVGRESGAVPGGRRRTGWFDAVALRRAILHNSVTGLCVTKLDVLDGLDGIRLCPGYRMRGAVSVEPPLLADTYADCEPVYE